MRHVALFSVLIACGDPNGGTAVGNPGKLSMQVEGLPPGADLHSGTFDVAALELAHGRRLTIVRFDEVFDLVEPGDIAFPAGAWDTAVLLPRGDEPLHLTGEAEDGTPFDVALPVEPMLFEGDFEVDGDDVIVGVSLRAVPADTFEDSAEPPAEPAGNGRGDVIGSLEVGEGIYLESQGDRVGATEFEQPSGGCSTVPASFGLWGLFKRR